MFITVKEAAELTGKSRQKIEKIIKENDASYIEGKNKKNQKVKKYNSEDIFYLIYNPISQDMAPIQQKQIEETKTIILKREILENQYIKKSEHEVILNDLFCLVSNFLRALKNKCFKLIPNKKAASFAVKSIDDFIDNYCDEIGKPQETN